MTSATRVAVRAVLINPDDQVLMFRYRNDPDVFNPGAEKLTRDYWGLVGGGVDTGEDLEQALFREILEETGHDEESIEIGPMLWHREIDLMMHGKLVHIDESYFVAFTDRFDVCCDAHTEMERRFVAENRWWNVDTVEKSDEIIFPEVLRKQLRPILSGVYPKTPLKLTV